MAGSLDSSKHNFLHMSSNVRSNVDEKGLYALVFSELKSLGVKVPKVKKFKTSVLKQDKSVEAQNKIFGTCLLEQDWITDANCTLPKFVSSATTYLNKFIGVEIGLFRKAGSIARQRQLRAKVENGEGFENAEPNDVAAVLKQWLRELPEPVIPRNLHDIFVKCVSLPTEDSLSAVLLCCLLLPSEHLYTLKHLLKFLSGIAENSTVNKMDPHNLAVIMAPNLLSCTCERPDKSSSGMVQSYTVLVELLILNADKVGEIPSRLSSLLSQKLGQDFPIEPLECSPARFQKKQRSGGVSDIVNGIRKFVGGNLTPLNNCMEHQQSADGQRTPPCRSAKRKADPELPSFVVAKKQAVGQDSNPARSPLFTPIGKSRFLSVRSTPGNTSLPNTPSAHQRRRSFGLLKSKRAKRGKSPKPISRGIKSSEGQIADDSAFQNDRSLPLMDCKSQQKNLCVPKIQIMTAASKPAPSTTASEIKVLKRAKSDQPLGTLKATDGRNMLSISQGKLPTRKASPARKTADTNIAPKKKSPLTQHATAQNKVRLPITKVRSPNVSPAVIKKSNVILPAHMEKQVFRRAGSTRRSSKRRPNLKLVDKTVSHSISSVSQSPHLRRNVSRNRSLRNGRKNLNAHSVSASQDNTDSSTNVLPNPECEKGLNCDEEMGIKSPCTDPIFTTPDTRRADTSAMKRGGNKSSLRRGRPNTVKTGLKSELCPKYSNESVTSLKFDQSDQLCLSVKKSKVESEETDMSKELPDITVDVGNSELVMLVNDDAMNDSVELLSINVKEKEARRESTGSMNSSITPHEIHAKPISPKFPEIIPRTASIEDFTEVSYVKPRRHGSSTNINILTPRTNVTPKHELDLSPFAVEDKYTLINEGKEIDLNSDLEIWRDATEITYLKPTSVESCKRESIVQLMIKNAGTVKANVQRYNHIAHNTVNKSENSTSVHNKAELNSSVSSNTSIYKITPSNNRLMLKSTESEPRLTPRNVTYRKSPLPPIPKFFVADIETVLPSPLKEVTNFTKSQSVSPANSIEASPVLPPPRKKDLNLRYDSSNMFIKTKKSIKAHRSESSPLFTAQRRESPRLKGKAVETPSPKHIKSPLLYSQSFNCAKEFEENNVPLRSTSKRSINSLNDFNTSTRSEWECDL